MSRPRQAKPRPNTIGTTPTRHRRPCLTTILTRPNPTASATTQQIWSAIMTSSSNQQPLITQGGMVATLQGYALAETPGGYVAWYLSMVGAAREAVRAIWAGLVDSRPRHTTLHIPTPDGLLSGSVELAPRDLSGGWRMYSARLPRSAAYQEVIVPRVALLHPERGGRGTSRDEAEASRTRPFVLLNVADQPLTLAQLYHARLDRRVRVPLLPQWANWTWAVAQQTGSATPLICGGAITGAYLCAVDEAQLAERVGAAIRSGELSHDYMRENEHEPSRSNRTRPLLSDPATHRRGHRRPLSHAA